MDILFKELKIGDIVLPNRIIMAPLTRCRAVNERIPNDLMVEYYTQRASAGLIITEATSISPTAVGYLNTPGIWSDEQVKGWQKVTDSVHKKNGRIFLQLWHVGRISHPFFLNGQQPVAPSAIAAEGYVRLLSKEEHYPIPRALDLNEIPDIIQAYKNAAINAKFAGFDGVEIHAANGYLIDQFLQDCSNERNDIYGGNITNRARFLLEITDAIIDIWGEQKVGVHLSPRCDSNSMGDSNKIKTFSYVVQELNKRNIGFIFTREYQDQYSITPHLRKLFKGVLIANEKFTKESASKTINAGQADAVAFGKLFLSNPDLPERFKRNIELNIPDPDSFYQSGASGYIDYPFIK
jgi:2,4-dienoyl-CoA reductase-like NADH-dependent reductase (Old Yellow Enzyme family)